MKKNSLQLWNDFWDSHISNEKYFFQIVKEEKSIRWNRIKKYACQKYLKLNGLKVIELGAGLGSYSYLFAKHGAKVTLVDYSETALRRSKELFNINKINAEFLSCNVLEMPKTLYGNYDISMSFGLAEHFTGNSRLQIIRNHFNVLNPNGLTFISVPNRFNLPYQIYKYLATLFGFWQVGEEYPFSRIELKSICRELGVEDYFFIGDSFFSSLHFLNPLDILGKMKGNKNLQNSFKLKTEKGTPFDEYISYALVLCANQYK